MNKLFYFALLPLFMTSCHEKVDKPVEIVPYPNDVKIGDGGITFDGSNEVKLPDQMQPEMQQTLNRFIDQLSLVSNLKFETVSDQDADIVFELKDGLGQEAYTLSIDDDRVKVQASTTQGFFYAIQSIKQMLPVEIYGNQATQGLDWSLPAVEIKDEPRFPYRGMHLDVSRHFFDTKEVKRFIDLLAMYKLNVFHWHLTDDQGWRIEIKKYPKLTSVGSVRNKTMIQKQWDVYDETPYGGYYTQEQIKEIVQYAADRQIEIIPEIDLPGHMMAALAAYPSLGCTEEDYEVSGQWGIRDDVLCVGRESTYDFIEDVLSEVVDLFPSKYIHIGGDECPKVRWEKCPDCQKKIKELGIKGDDKHSEEHYLQSYVINRVEKFLNEKGRSIIGWDEILEGGLAPNATVMSWRGEAGGIQAAQEGHDVIMTPTSYMYFDYYQTPDTQNEPLSIGGCVTVDRVYSYNPIPDVLTPEESKRVLGAQANLWTEYIPTVEQLEYQLLPRLAALSEVQWTQLNQKSWERFLHSMHHQVSIYDFLGYNYAKHLFRVQGNISIDKDQRGVEVSLAVIDSLPIYYTLDGTMPTTKSAVYHEKLKITKDTKLVASALINGQFAQPYERTFKFNKLTGILGTVVQGASPKYTYKGVSTLTDGTRGVHNYASGAWLGSEDNPFEIDYSLDKEQEISSLTVGSLVQYGEYIFPPKAIKLYVKNAKGKYDLIAEKTMPKTTAKSKDGLYDFTCSFKPIKAKDIKVVVENVNSIPAWHGAKGLKGWVFVDELILN